MDEGEMIQVDRRLWLTADRDRLVEDGDPDARFLWSPLPGHLVPKSEADMFGYKPQKQEKARSAKS